MRKLASVLLVLLITCFSLFGQQYKVEKSAPFEPHNNWSKLLQLSNGNTLLVSYEWKKGFVTVVYDKSRVEISRKIIGPEELKKQLLVAVGVYEIKGEAVLFMMKVEITVQSHTLFRLRINGSTGDMISSDILGKLPKINSWWGNEAIEWANADPNNIYVEKDPVSDCYAVVFFNGSAKDRNERIHTIHYDGAHKILSESFYESPDGAFKYLNYVGMTVDGSKRLFLTTYGRNGKSSDQKPRLIVSVLNAGDTSFKHNVLNFTEEFGFTRSLMLYNHSTNRIQMLSLTAVKSKTNILTDQTTAYYALLLSYIDPETLGIIDFKFYGATKATEYARKNLDPDFKFSGMPQDMILNSDNTTTILSEEMKSIIKMPVLVSIGVSNLSDTGAEMHGYVISKRQYGSHQSMQINKRRRGYNSDIHASGSIEFMSYAYIDAPGGRYIIFNDLDANFEKNENETRRAVLQKPSEGNTVCYKLGEGKVDKFYLFGEPEKRKTMYCNLDASSYDNSTHTLAALVYTADNARPKDIRVVWVTFE